MEKLNACSLVRLLMVVFTLFSMELLADPAGVWARDSDDWVNAPIIDAAYDGNWQKVIKLAKEDRRNLDETDFEQTSVLHLAAQRSGDSVIRVLLHLGADKNAKDIAGRRPYDYACENGKVSKAVRNMLR